MRKNIFELLQRDYDLNKEACKIETLIHTPKKFLYNKKYIEYGLETFVDHYLFLDWEYRDTTINISELRELLGISNQKIMDKSGVDFNTFLKYAEYVLNIIFLVLRESGNIIHIIPILTNIRIIIEHFNFRIYELDKEKVKIIVIENNPSATAVAEMVEDNNVKRDIIRYNHFMLKGDIYEKKKILSQLYKEYEKIKPLMKDESLKRDLGFVFNSLGIRHDKGDNEITNELVKTMKDKDIENWCDKVYELFLAAELHINYLNYKGDIAGLKKGDDIDKE